MYFKANLTKKILFNFYPYIIEINLPILTNFTDQNLFLNIAMN